MDSLGHQEEGTERLESRLRTARKAIHQAAAV